MALLYGAAIRAKKVLPVLKMSSCQMCGEILLEWYFILEFLARIICTIAAFETSQTDIGERMQRHYLAAEGKVDSVVANCRLDQEP